MDELRRRLPDHVSKIYYPIDRRKHIQRALGMVHPDVMVFVEAEIWPNMIWGLQRLPVLYRSLERGARGVETAGDELDAAEEPREAFHEARHTGA